MSKKKILIVEDEGLIAADIKESLIALGYEVVAMATSGEEALKKMESMKTDLVLMDIVLGGGMNGIETTREINFRFDVPVIYLTAYTNEEMLEKAKVTEPYGYIIKPFNERDLHTIIEIALYKHKTEKKLKESEGWLSTTLRSIGDAVIATDSKGCVKLMNQAAQLLTGWKEEEAVGKPVGDIIIIVDDKTGKVAENPVTLLLKEGRTVDPPDHNYAASIAKNETKIPVDDSRTRTLDSHGNIIDAIVSNEEKTFLSKDGRKIPVFFSSSVIRDKDGKIQGLICLAQDITVRKLAEEETKRMQAKMISASKLATLGEVATGAAHEINQPLTFISGFIQSLARDVTKGLISHANETELKESLKDASYQIDRIVFIIDHLRDFGRQFDIKIEKIDIKKVLDNTLLLIGKRIRSRNIKLVRHIEENLPMVLGNANQIEQVFINLFQNAIDAFGEKIKSAEISVDISSSDNTKTVQIKFADNGSGIEESIMDKIFEPFFTTKEVGKGTGLGLSIAYGIIKEHKGSITCESTVHHGTTFNILLPVGGSNVK